METLVKGILDSYAVWSWRTGAD